jgi:hypothetical protein
MPSHYASLLAEPVRPGLNGIHKLFQILALRRALPKAFTLRHGMCGQRSRQVYGMEQEPDGAVESYPMNSARCSISWLLMASPY